MTPTPSALDEIIAELRLAHVTDGPPKMVGSSNVNCAKILEPEEPEATVI
jgi:hypothetical protein